MAAEGVWEKKRWLQQRSFGGKSRELRRFWEKREESSAGENERKIRDTEKRKEKRRAEFSLRGGLRKKGSREEFFLEF